ncbi:ABC transporter type 1, transmembrane domain-containing protein [Blakeslea trispora]|nr:ABC transporter type 1, transmembrane domain-containing protein [Blakeslea trispora]
MEEKVTKADSKSSRPSTPTIEEVPDVDTKAPSQPLDEALKPASKEKPKNKKAESVSIFQLFRFATVKERFMIMTALFFSIAAGALMPCSILIYGQYISRITTTLNNTSNLLDATVPVIHIMAYMGTASLVSGYMSNCLWVLTGESQTRRIRAYYLHSVLNQDMSWFDKAADGSLNTRLASDTQIIQDGISESSARSMAYFIAKYTIAAQQSYAKGGTVAEQAFQSIRTVYAFTLQKRFLKRYEDRVEEASQFGIRRGIAMGAGFAVFMFILFCSYGLSLWYGSGLVMQGELDGSAVFVVFIAMMIG